MSNYCLNCNYIIKYCPEHDNMCILEYVALPHLLMAHREQHVNVKVNSRPNCRHSTTVSLSGLIFEWYHKNHLFCYQYCLKWPAACLGWRDIILSYNLLQKNVEKIDKVSRLWSYLIFEQIFSPVGEGGGGWSERHIFTCICNSTEQTQLLMSKNVPHRAWHCSASGYV